jgi:hypothetical protein
MNPANYKNHKISQRPDYDVLINPFTSKAKILIIPHEAKNHSSNLESHSSRLPYDFYFKSWSYRLNGINSLIRVD